MSEPTSSGPRRKPTMIEIARLAGVSQATVSRVINGHPSVKPETRERVLRLVRELGFEPNANARSLVCKKSNLIGVIVPDVCNPFFPEVLRAVVGEASTHGYSVLIFDTRGSEHAERQYLATLRGYQVEGILLVPSNQKARHLRSLARYDTPVVILTQSLPDFDFVAVDHVLGGRLVAQHFLELGHTQVGFLGSSEDPKFAGFQAALAEAGLPFERARLIECHSWTELLSNKLHRELQLYLQRGGARITGLFAYNDMAAMVASKVFEEHGWRIGQDIAIAGFDNTSLALALRPGLTSVAQPTSEIGRIAVEILLTRIRGEEDRAERIQVFLPPRLVVRASTTGVTLRV